MRVSNAPYPTTLLRGYFDIVNLPDFDEVYAVRRIQGLGSVDYELTTGQGNILQGFNGNVNNEAITTLTLGLIQAGAQAASTKGLSALGLPALLGGTSGLIPGAGDGRVETEGDLAGTRSASYEPISLVVTVISFATPGVYPIMKPREVVDWSRLRGAYALNYAGAMAYPLDQGLAVKLGPYGIPYKTFEYVLVEKALGGRSAYTVITTPSRPVPPSPAGSTGTGTELKARIVEILGGSAADWNILVDDRDVIVEPAAGKTFAFRNDQARISANDRIRGAIPGGANITLPLSSPRISSMVDALKARALEKGWVIALDGDAVQTGPNVKVKATAITGTPTSPPAWTRDDVAGQVNAMFADRVGSVNTPAANTGLAVAVD